MLSLRLLSVASLLMTGSSIAVAGGFVGLGVGPSPSLNGDNVNNLEGTGRTARLFLGYRILQFSVEGQLTANSTTDSVTDQEDYSATHAALYGKYSHPLGSGFEAFGKLGLVRSSYGNDNAESLTGSGLGAAAGVELRVPLGISAIAFGLEYGLTSVGLDLTDGTQSTVRSGQWLLSASIGM